MKYLNVAKHVQSNEQLETLLTLIDLSGSMYADDIKPNRKEAAIKANQEIVRVKTQHHPNDKIGVIGFEENAKFLLKPTHPSAIGDLAKKINDTGLTGGTDFTSPLKLAYSCFFGRAITTMKNPLAKMLSSFFFEPGIDKCFSIKTTDGSTRRIILLTDGEHLGYENPIHIATRLKRAGVVIDCIGIGGSPRDVGEKLLKQIASRNPDGSIRYCFIGNQRKLLRKYQTLAHHIRAI